MVHVELDSTCLQTLYSFASKECGRKSWCMIASSSAGYLLMVNYLVVTDGTLVCTPPCCIQSANCANAIATGLFPS